MAVSVSVTEVVGGGWGLSCGYHWRLRQLPNTPLYLQNPKPIRCFATTNTRRWCSCVVARALEPKTGDQNSTTSSSASQEEDLWYVAKLVVGSFVGAAAIKYGSALFPQITTPNLELALIIISTPVLVAVFLLIKQSRLNP